MTILTAPAVTNATDLKKPKLSQAILKHPGATIASESVIKRLSIPVTVILTVSTGRLPALRSVRAVTSSNIKNVKKNQPSVPPKAGILKATGATVRLNAGLNKETCNE